LLFDEQFVEQFHDGRIDKFRPIITVKSENAEWETQQQFFEYWDQESLADALASGHPFALGNTVHGIDVIDAFDAIQIALMDGVHAQVAGSVIRRRGAALTDGNAHRSRLGPDLALTLISGAFAQVVQMPYRDRRQALVAYLAKDQIGTLHELLGGQPR